MGDGLPNDFDHRPGVEGGLGKVDASALGDPLEELVQAERVAAFWLLLQVPAELGRELSGQLVLEPAGQPLGQGLKGCPGGLFGVAPGVQPCPGLDLSDELVVLRADALLDGAKLRRDQSGGRRPQLGAMGAAEYAAVGLHTVADDPAAAVGAGGRDRVDRAFELSKVWVAPATMTWNALS